MSYNWEGTINSFVPSAPFLYPRKNQKTLPFSDILKGQKKGALKTDGLNGSLEGLVNTLAFYIKLSNMSKIFNRYIF